MNFWLVTSLTLIGFFGLAAMLLIPVWRFLSREEEVAEHWTRDTVEPRDTVEIRDTPVIPESPDATWQIQRGNLESE